MFFPERIKAIAADDKVLEIGPGGSPYPRSDVFLELKYEDDEDARLQRSYSEPLKTDKKVVHYDGGRFPFDDGEFDYVVASHVLEHVPDVASFVGELNRVAAKGYVEFPTIYYEFLYNIPTHLNLLFERDGVVRYLKKLETPMPAFASVQRFYYRCLCLGFSGDLKELKHLYFQGFEWFGRLSCETAANIEDLIYDYGSLKFPEKPQRRKDIFAKLRRLFR